MKTILVPTDFSPSSVNALHYAAEMAVSIDASLLLVHVFQVPVTFSEVPVVTVSVDELKKASEETLDELKNAVNRITGSKVKIYKEALLGETVDELYTLCEKINPFAVVMGTHGSTGLERAVMGSTTLSTIRHLKSPVIAVPPGTTFKGIRKIGLACDFKNVTASMPIEFIKAVINEFDPTLDVLHVASTEDDANMPLESAHLDTLLEGIKPSYHFLHGQEFMEGIRAFAEKNNLDLLIVIPKKHKLLEGIFHKSSSAALIRNTHIPVMAIHEE
jgi:nucleotide-binding universal stress UspA family protein